MPKLCTAAERNTDEEPRYTVHVHKPGTAWQPLILNPNSPDDHRRLLSLRGQGDVLECDQLETQLEGLATVRAPKAQLDQNPRALAREVASLRDSTVYAKRRWVYFPWRRQLVHTLGRDEYAELRSNRNLYKLGPREQQHLRTKTVGVVGLSVGRSSAATMALEGVAGVCSDGSNRGVVCTLVMHALRQAANSRLEQF